MIAKTYFYSFSASFSAWGKRVQHRDTPVHLLSESLCPLFLNLSKLSLGHGFKFLTSLSRKLLTALHIGAAGNFPVFDKSVRRATTETFRKRVCARGSGREGVGARLVATPRKTGQWGWWSGKRATSDEPATDSGHPQTGVVDVSYARRKRASPARRWHQGEEVGARVAWAV